MESLVLKQNRSFAFIIHLKRMLRVSGKVGDELKDCVYYERILNVRDGIFASVRMCTIQLELFRLYNRIMISMKICDGNFPNLKSITSKHLTLRNKETFREIFKKFSMKLYVGNFRRIKYALKLVAK